MLTISEYTSAQLTAAEMIQESGIYITLAEIQQIEVVDFNLNHHSVEGVQRLTLLQTDHICVQIFVLFPHQIQPELCHPPFKDNPGKEETFRVISGSIFLYLPGGDQLNESIIPAGKRRFFTSHKEIILQPGAQITIQAGTRHWYRADSEGGIMFCFSNGSYENRDKFSDPMANWTTQIGDD